MEIKNKFQNIKKIYYSMKIDITKIDITKIICSSCLIIFKEHNPHKGNDKYVIKYKKNIDIDGNDTDHIFYVTCVACKELVNIGKCYIFQEI